jgi:acyl-coenzyme A synthetase/AMP-(fatty) acid ligase
MTSVFDSSPFPLCPKPFNMAAHVLGHADSLANKLALRVVAKDAATPDHSFSYSQLKRAVLGTATGLLNQGLRPGDIVLMRLGNTPDFPIAYLGALAAGLVPVPTSAALTKTEVARIIADLAPCMVIRDPNVDGAPGPPEVQLETLRDWRGLTPAKWHMGDPDRLGYVIYTSGTSGHPRAVAHAHRAIWARQMMHQGWYGLGPDDVMMHAGAFNWTYTLGTGLMDPWTLGATALILAPGTPLDALPHLLVQERATIFAAAPGVYRQMLASGTIIKAPSLRHGLSAGEKLPISTHAAWTKATGTPLFEAYGMSECSTFISACPDAPGGPETIGQPQPGRKVAILGANGPAPADTPGIISVNRDDQGLMLGYLHQPDETAEKFQGDWFLTGDIGKMGADGQITYLGRNDDMMNAGGFRVSPVEVEAALADTPGLTGVGAAEVEVKTGTRIIVAFYTGPTPLDEAALHAYARDRLAIYKQPRAYLHVPYLPTGANGKLLRRRLPAFWPTS